MLLGFFVLAMMKGGWANFVFISVLKVVVKQLLDLMPLWGEKVNKVTFAYSNVGVSGVTDDFVTFLLTTGFLEVFKVLARTTEAYGYLWNRVSDEGERAKPSLGLARLLVIVWLLEVS